MKLRTVIVDDEPLALDLLRSLLAAHEDIDIVAECENGRQALAWLQSNPVDLLFLDVQMPKIDGFGVVERIGLQHLPPTIFVTAYHEHAVQAFDINAVDYLTKPVEAPRLRMALERVRRKIDADRALLTREQLTAVLNGLRPSEESKCYTSRFLVKDGEKEILLASEKIDWVEAADYYSRLHVGTRTYMLRESITDLSEALDPRHFVRIHRASIINLDRVREIYRDGQSDGSVILTTGVTLRMSRTGRQKLLESGKK